MDNIEAENWLNNTHDSYLLRKVFDANGSHWVKGTKYNQPGFVCYDINDSFPNRFEPRLPSDISYQPRLDVGTILSGDEAIDYLKMNYNNCINIKFDPRTSCKFKIINNKMLVYNKEANWTEVNKNSCMMDYNNTNYIIQISDKTNWTSDLWPPEQSFQKEVDYLKSKIESLELKIQELSKNKFVGTQFNFDQVCSALISGKILIEIVNQENNEDIYFWRYRNYFECRTVHKLWTTKEVKFNPKSIWINFD